jgi:hypothetical protein
MRIRLLIGALALLLYPFIAWSQVDEDTGDRENYVLAPNGDVLVVTQPNDDQASLVRRAPNGVEMTYVSYNQGLSGGTVDGIGSNPHMNAGGVAAFQVCLNIGADDCDSGSGDADDGDNGIYTGTPGSITTIAVSGDTVVGEDICIIEPFPLINVNNQVFWGTTVEGGDGVTNTCDEDGDHSTNGRKAIYRFTPPSTDTLMLLADVQGSVDGGDTVTAVAPFGTDTYDILDAHLIAFGGDAVTSSGNALVTAYLQDPPGARKGDVEKGIPAGDRTALLYVTPSTISLVAMDDNEGTAPGDGSPIGWLGKGVANANGLVFFKGEQTDDEDSPATMNLWTLGGGISELVATGDGLPLGPGSFQGFAPHQDLNSSGDAAFTAGLSITSSCDDRSPDIGFVPGWNGDVAGGDSCRGVYYSPDGSSLIEIARDTKARSLTGVGNSSSPDGFQFLVIGSVAVMAENGTVFFVAENQTPDSQCGLGDPNAANTELEFGGRPRFRAPPDGIGLYNDITGVFAAIGGVGVPVKVIAEGDVLPEGKVMRLFTPMPELRQHDSGDDFVIRAWFDTTGNCLSDTEEIILATAEPFVIPIIPTLGPWGIWLLIGFLALVGGGRLLRQRS